MFLFELCQCNEVFNKEDTLDFPSLALAYGHQANM